MEIVAGHLVVDTDQRESYLEDCVSVVEEARKAPWCLDFTVAADLVDPGRIDAFERWESQADVEAFRGSGPSEEQGVAMVQPGVDLRSSQPSLVCRLTIRRGHGGVA